MDFERATKQARQMCESENRKGCEHQGKLKGKPEECSPEEIRECHGDVEEHRCANEKQLSKRICRLRPMSY